MSIDDMTIALKNVEDIRAAVEAAEAFEGWNRDQPMVLLDGARLLLDVIDAQAAEVERLREAGLGILAAVSVGEGKIVAPPALVPSIRALAKALR